MLGPGGWLVYRLVDHNRVNVSLTEIRSEWTLRDIVDAWRRADYYDRLAEEEASQIEAQKSRQR